MKFHQACWLADSFRHNIGSQFNQWLLCSLEIMPIGSSDWSLGTNAFSPGFNRLQELEVIAVLSPFGEQDGTKELMPLLDLIELIRANTRDEEELYDKDYDSR